MDISAKNYRAFISEREALGGMFHAMIISGPDCNEKTIIVNALAAAILCSSQSGKPCGKCADCRKASQNIHPDIQRLRCPEDKKEIPVGDVRALRADASVIPNDSDRKVYIIEGDRLNEQGQNVLLKTLEEPPKFTYFIICANNPGILLDTVRSRCTELRLVSAEASSVSEEAAEAARELVELSVGEDKYALMEHINSLGKASRALLAEISSECRRLCVEKLKHGQSTAAKKRLLNVISTFEEVSEYLDLNVSTVHILGLIMAGIC